MRTHSDIIRDAGGPTRLARAIGAEANNVKAWSRNNSIPGPYWQAISDGRIASLEELAAAVAKPLAADADFDISPSLPGNGAPVQPAQPAALSLMGERP